MNTLASNDIKTLAILYENHDMTIRSRNAHLSLGEKNVKCQNVFRPIYLLVYTKANTDF